MLYPLQVIMRCLHFCSLAVLLGGVAYWRLILIPSTVALPADECEDLSERDAAAFRPFVLVSMCGLILSGVYNILAYPGHNRTHNILLIVKLLLAAHVFAAILGAVRKNNKKRTRALTGVVVSGIVIIAISATLKVIY